MLYACRDKQDRPEFLSYDEVWAFVQRNAAGLDAAVEYQWCSDQHQSIN